MKVLENKCDLILKNECLNESIERTIEILSMNVDRHAVN